MFCVITGGIFLEMAITGEQACRELLGDSLWQGASPVVMIKDSLGLRGGCNFSGIKHFHGK